jgi:hypothetical protein
VLLAWRVEVQHIPYTIRRAQSALPLWMIAGMGGTLGGRPTPPGIRCAH